LQRRLDATMQLAGTLLIDRRATSFWRALSLQHPLSKQLLA
jgi:hypothetical protein